MAWGWWEDSEGTARGKRERSQEIARQATAGLYCCSIGPRLVLDWSSTVFPHFRGAVRVLLRQPNGTTAVALSLFDSATAETLRANRSEEHTSELQSLRHLVC